MPWEPLALLRAVREVATLADPAASQIVTQAAFDAARPTPGPYADMPRAKRITEQLRLRKWSRVLNVAHVPEEKYAQLLGWKTKNEEQDWLTQDYVTNLLKLVAHRRGADSLTLQDYDEERVKLVAEDHKRWLHGRQLLVPKSGQIEQALGSWTAALRLAELKTPRERNATRDATRAPTHAELLDRFWHHYKVLPMKPDLLAFARGNGIPYPGENKTTFGKERTAWIKARRAEGVAVPDETPPREECADYSRDVGAALPGERRRKQWRNVADCVAVLKRYLAQLPPGEPARAESYRAWARGNGAPAPNQLTQHGGWTAVRKLAQGELQHEPAKTTAHVQRRQRPESRRSRPTARAR
jgi:hypothetical protein